MAVSTVPKLTGCCALSRHSQSKHFSLLQPRLRAASHHFLPAPFVTAVTNTSYKQQEQRCLRCRAQHDLVVPEDVLEPVPEPQARGGARELLTWVYELPWTRVAIWATVALTASQFQDFFGVTSARFPKTCRMHLVLGANFPHHELLKYISESQPIGSMCRLPWGLS